MYKTVVRSILLCPLSPGAADRPGTDQGSLLGQHGNQTQGLMKVCLLSFKKGAFVESKREQREFAFLTRGDVTPLRLNESETLGVLSRDSFGLSKGQ